MDIKEKFNLAELTTFHIGGPADFFVEVKDENELAKALNFARLKKLPVLVLGKGSNVLVSDQGFRGLVIQNKINGLQIEDNGFVSVGAGENWDDIVASTVAKNLAGIECLSGVPGSAGGAVVQNIGAYGQTIADLIVDVFVSEVATGTQKIFSAYECEFMYRSSFFKKNSNKYIVTRFDMRLKPNGAPTLTYADAKKYFEAKPQPTLAQLRDFIIQTRGEKGYLIMPGFDSYNTAGSFFKNPVVSSEEFEKLKSMFGHESTNRFWPTHDGVKLAAAFLMQEAGFGKGYQEGSVGISPKHSLSLVNLGGGKAAEIKALAEKIKNAVFRKFGVRLEEEVIYV